MKFTWPWNWFRKAKPQPNIESALKLRHYVPSKDPRTEVIPVKVDGLGRVDRSDRNYNYYKRPGGYGGSGATRSFTPSSPPAASPSPRDDSSFLTSMLVAQATDSAVLGTLAGNNIAGALVGSAMADHSHRGRDSDADDATVFGRPAYTPDPAPAPVEESPFRSDRAGFERDSSPVLDEKPSFHYDTSNDSSPDYSSPSPDYSSSSDSGSSFSSSD